MIDVSRGSSLIFVPVCFCLKLQLTTESTGLKLMRKLGIGWMASPSLPPMVEMLLLDAAMASAQTHGIRTL